MKRNLADMPWSGEEASCENMGSRRSMHVMSAAQRNKFFINQFWDYFRAS